MTRDEGRARIRERVQAFRQNEAEYTRSGGGYNETQARTDFITPLLMALGWDVKNDNRRPLDLREVFEEATVEVGEERLSKKPDYELRLARQRKFFVEAKKPSVRIDRDRDAVFQTRRYGFSASLPISVLTNFHQLAIYDCVPPPRRDDDPRVARIALYSFDAFDSRFDELYDCLSRDVVYSGQFDERFHVGVTRHGTQQFDDHFLEQVRDWRLRLAADLHGNNPALGPAELTYAVQLFLSRLVFLRICEDREIEKYETLRELGREGTFDGLMGLLRRADDFYDSGLFRLLNDARLGVRFSNDVLFGIIDELYYPQSSYTFSVVESGVLGEIYELFLGEVITLNDAGEIEIVEKPEVRESGGVVPTPQFIVDAILDRAMLPAIDGRSPQELASFRVADVCCGSGIFLLAAYERLLTQHLSWYLANDRGTHDGVRIYEAVGGRWGLTLAEKRRILTQCIRGVDIDANAVEVTRFSLLLKLIEDETAEGLQSYAEQRREAVLPSLDETIRCGNTLVAHAEYQGHDLTATGELLARINPFTWSREFPAEMAAGGFDVIVGNPPYIRIQNMVAYSPEEVAFYQSDVSPYRTAESDNFDKYALFVERSFSLLKPGGRLGFIVPHKFMTITAGRAVRRLIAHGRYLSELVHFGAQQVFGVRSSNYTCVLVLAKAEQAAFRLEKVRDLSRWRYGQAGEVEVLPSGRIGDEPWGFVAGSAQAVFDRVLRECPGRLAAVADIFVGVQTSADEIYIFSPKAETGTNVTFEWNGQDWAIEREILRPCLHDVQLTAFGKPKPNKFMIFPYKIVANKAKLIQPDEMAEKFPGALAYFVARKSDLAKRHVSGGPASEQQWYQYGRSQSLTKFNSPKIILPILSLEPRYAYDDDNIVVTGGGNGPYYLVRPKPGEGRSLFFLLAVLCHPLSEAMVRSKTSVFRGGYYSHGKQFIEVIPVPTATSEQHDEIVTLVERAIGASSAAEQATTPQARTIKEREAVALREEIEKQISVLFGLDDAEVEAVRAVPVPS